MKKKTRLSDIQLNTVGIGLTHPIGFTIDRPRGMQDYLFLHFLRPVEIFLQKAGRQIVEPHSCMLYSPGIRQWYRGYQTGLANDFVHAEGSEMVRLIRQYRIPVNMPFRPHRADFITPILSRLRSEWRHPDKYSARNISLLCERLFLEIGRSIHTDTAQGFSPRKREWRERLLKIRTQLYDQPQNNWSVPEMCAMGHISKSRLGTLYHEFFGVSPGEDMIRARLERAKWLLTSTTMKIANVAEQSGFVNFYHFSRLFHRRIGCTASQYTRQPT